MFILAEYGHLLHCTHQKRLKKHNYRKSKCLPLLLYFLKQDWKIMHSEFEVTATLHTTQHRILGLRGCYAWSWCWHPLPISQPWTRQDWFSISLRGASDPQEAQLFTLKPSVITRLEAGASSGLQAFVCQCRWLSHFQEGVGAGTGGKQIPLYLYTQNWRKTSGRASVARGGWESACQCRDFV